MHVALFDSMPSRTHPNGDPALSKIIEFSAQDGLTVRAVDLNEDWAVVKRVEDQEAALARLVNVLKSGAP